MNVRPGGVGSTEPPKSVGAGFAGAGAGAWALYAFAVGLALHNFVMAELWDAGVRGFALDFVSAWKEALLAGALGLVLWRSRALRPPHTVRCSRASSFRCRSGYATSRNWKVIGISRCSAGELSRSSRRFR